ncbi:unnamed protein product [Echinostoma caproni]|uniref:Aldo_ket_red domain-containing protein n=1 Tax=Echinostoma caproni TaxID=27848 RepID=A0A183AP59_9TREM|nr:unnamed protein product [Echinostoma caproni]
MKMPVLGYGTYLKMKINIRTALEAGYRLIDCAFFYENEKAIGEAIKEALESLKLKREDIFVTSKVWPTHVRPENVRKSCEQSLKDLQLSYLDLFLVHWPVAFQVGCQHVINVLFTSQAMEKLVDDGLVKSIGLSNFNKRQIDFIMANSRIKPVNLQIEAHANFPNEKLVRYAQSKGLTVSAYAPLGSLGNTPYVFTPIGIELMEWFANTMQIHWHYTRMFCIRLFPIVDYYLNE